MAAAYSKAFMPLGNVKGKEFMSRPMGCKGVGFSFVRCKPGEGATYVHRHKVQEEVFIALKGDGTIILDGKRIRMPEGTIVRVGPRVWRALGNDSKKEVGYMILGAVPPKGFPLGGPNAAGRRHSQSKPSAALEKGVTRAWIEATPAKIYGVSVKRPVSRSSLMLTLRFPIEPRAVNTFNAQP